MRGDHFFCIFSFFCTSCKTCTSEKKASEGLSDTRVNVVNECDIALLHRIANPLKHIFVDFSSIHKIGMQREV